MDSKYYRFKKDHLNKLTNNQPNYSQIFFSHQTKDVIRFFVFFQKRKKNPKINKIKLSKKYKI